MQVDQIGAHNNADIDNADIEHNVNESSRADNRTDKDLNMGELGGANKYEAQYK